jgi:NodT family efflux transporter outer membrane factor (OMF) lipoprotein
MKTMPTADAYKEVAPWTTAQTLGRLPRDAWWTLYGDAQLNALQNKLIAGNPDLATALANYDHARAYANIVDGEASYELDLWHRIRNNVASGKAPAAASSADLKSARLSLSAQLADGYVVLRGFDRDSALLEDMVKTCRCALDLAIDRHDGSIATGLDVAGAQAQLEAASSQAAQTLAQRELMERAIVALAGESASRFSITPQIVDIGLPQVPTDIPSTLLRRRPDIAAEQRRVEAATAAFGAACASYFPSVAINPAGGNQRARNAGWMTAPNSHWAVGPSMPLTMVDAGKRKAQAAEALAALGEASARYRGVALTAFQEVEDNLALLDHHHDAWQAGVAAVEAAERSLDFSMDRYRKGAANYLDVVTSQTAALQTQRDALALETLQLRASVALIRALGGGWESPIVHQSVLTDTRRRLHAVA